MGPSLPRRKPFCFCFGSSSLRPPPPPGQSLLLHVGQAKLGRHGPAPASGSNVKAPGFLTPVEVQAELEVALLHARSLARPPSLQSRALDSPVLLWPPGPHPEPRTGPASAGPWDPLPAVNREPNQTAPRTAGLHSFEEYRPGQGYTFHRWPTF